MPAKNMPRGKGLMKFFFWTPCPFSALQYTWVNNILSSRIFVHFHLIIHLRYSKHSRHVYDAKPSTPGMQIPYGKRQKRYFTILCTMEIVAFTILLLSYSLGLVESLKFCKILKRTLRGCCKEKPGVLHFVTLAYVSSKKMIDIHFYC